MNSGQILVTGATGFIGRALCNYLEEHCKDRSVVALVRKRNDLPIAVDQIEVSDWSLPGLKNAIASKSVTTIFHLAAYGVSPTNRDAELMREINSELPVTMVRLADHLNASIITAGSSAEYAASAENLLLTEDAPLCTDKPYGASKASGWLAASATALKHNVNMLHLRLFNVYGPNETQHRLFPSLVNSLSAGDHISLSDGEQIRDFVYADDVCRAFLAAEEALRGTSMAEVVNVCTGEGASVKTFAKLVCEKIGANSVLLGFGDIERRPDDTPYLVGDPSKMTDLLQLGKMAKLESGIKMSVNSELETA